MDLSNTNLTKILITVQYLQTVLKRVMQVVQGIAIGCHNCTRNLKFV